MVPTLTLSVVFKQSYLLKHNVEISETMLVLFFFMNASTGMMLL